MGNNEYSLTDYRNGFNEFNNFIISIYKNASIYYTGYFVENQKYNAFKKQYEDLLSLEQKQVNPEMGILENYKMNTEKVELLKNNLLNNKEYIFINEGLYQLICKKNDEEKNKNLVNLYSDVNDVIIYDIKENKPLLRLKKNQKNIFNRFSLYLNPENNTVNSSQQSANNNNTSNNIINNASSDNYNKMSQDIINFYLNEKKISGFLNSQSKNNYKGFLVDEYWVQKWKNYYDYDTIEANFLKNKFNDSQIQSAKLGVTNYLSQKKLNNIYPESVLPSILQDLNKIKNNNTSYILLDENFMNPYINYSINTIRPINFIITNNTIKIENPPLNFNTNKNILNKSTLSDEFPNNKIISQNSNMNSTQTNNFNNDAENSLLLKHLLKYEYFKKEYYLSNPNYKIAFAIDYQIIKKLIDIYNSDKIIANLNSQIQGINYQTFDINYQAFLNIINNSMEKTPSIQELNNLKNEMNSSSFIKLFNNQSNRLYLDNFVLIDQEFATFLSHKINNNIKMFLVYYRLVENKIFMVIKVGQAFFYQVSSFIDDDNFIAEYIIFSNYPNYTNISNYILSLFSNNKLQNLVRINLPINYINNIQFYIYPINNSLNQVIIGQQNNNFMKQGSIKNFERINSIDNIGARTELKRRISFNRVNNNGFAQIIRNSLTPVNDLNNTYISTSNINFDKVSNIKSNNNNFEQNLFLSISIIKERQKLLSEINYPNGNKNEPKKEYYLVNKNYLKEISDKLNLENIFILMQQNQYKSDADLLSFVKTNLNDKVKGDLNNLNKEDMQKILKSKEKFGLNHYFVNNNKNTHLLYYKHCDIISERLFELLKNIDPDINNKCQKVECVFDKGIIIIFINKYIINVANFDNEIIAKQIIISSGQNNSYNLSLIFNTFSQKGYNDFMKSFVNSNNLINFKFNQSYIVQANIINITDDGRLVYQPSYRLKTMILLAVSQQYFNENQKERVYLMNHEWLKEYKYYEIKEKFLRIFNSRGYQWDLSYNFDSISTIIQSIDQEELKKYDEKVTKIRNTSFMPSLIPIQLPNKYIDSYKKFVLINDKMYEHFNKAFGISFPNDNIYYIHKSSNLDYLCFQNYQLKNQYNPNNIQNYILVGNINRDENKFVVSYILDYNDGNIIEREMQNFIKNDFQNYLHYKVGLTNPNEIFSPIFDNNQIIGNYYNINKGFDPKKCVNYSNILSNNQLWATAYLYYNEQSISKKLKIPSYNDEDFYFINKQLLSLIQTKYNYGQLKKYFEGKLNNGLPSQRDMYIIIRSLHPNDLKNLTSNLYPGTIQQAEAASYNIDIIPIQNPNNPNEMYWILDKFELVEIQFAKEYLKEQYPYHILKCSFLGNNMIAFHYPNNKLNNLKYFFLISKIDEKKNFINEYLLIYNSPNYINHFKQIRNNLINFLQKQEYINNTYPLVVDGYNQIGTIIRLSGSGSDLLPPQTDHDHDLYIPPIPLLITDSLKDFPSKPLVGFENIGATCYMNATLQCLCNIKKLVDYFKYNKHLIEKVEKDKEKKLLCSAFKRLIESLYDYKGSKNYQNFLLSKGTSLNSKSSLKSSYAPRNFKETISRMNSLFEGIAANDAKDLVNFLLMTLHTELNRAPQEEINNAGNLFLDQRNKSNMFNIFVENFKKTNRSIISDLFYALNCNVTQCGNCGTVSFNYQIYFFLIFPLEEVRKFRLMNNGFNNNLPNNTVDIYDCFNYDMKINYMGGDNALYCNYCKQTCPSSMCTQLTTGPEILVIILNRGQGIQFDVKIKFDFYLDLTNYIELKDTGCYYELFGVITHIGNSDMSGHFIAYCKSYWNNIWYRFNDNLVTPVNNFQKEVIDFAMPYLLFYKKNLKN